MELNNKPQLETKYDYGSLFLSAILLLGVSQAVENIQTPVGEFFRGVMIGMSIACSLIGFASYIQSQKKR